MDKKDWVGSKKSTFVTLGASNHTKNEREKNDYYATDPKAIDYLVNEEKLFDVVLEPFCGEGHLSKRLEELGYTVFSSDLIARGYGKVKDFFEYRKEDLPCLDIVSNPPYKFALECVKRSIELVDNRRKVCMFLKLTFLEGKERKKFFRDFPPKVVYVSSSRIKCAINGDFGSTGSSAACYAWFVWEKGFTGDTIVKWIN